MTDKKQDLSPVAKRRTKLIYESFQEEPDDREMLFQSSVFAHVFLPRRDPKLPLNEIWEQESGKFSVYVMPMPVRNPITHETTYLGLPYGVKARIILATLNTIALRTQNRVIPMPSDNLTDFNAYMGFSEGGSQINAVRDQVSRLASCVIRMTYDGKEGQENINMPIVSGFTLFPEKQPDQIMLWPSEIKLSQDYFENLMEHAVPLAKSHLTALSNNVTALDLYTFLAHRLHRIPHNRPQFLAWKTIYDQFGGDYDRVRAFRDNFIKVLRLVKSLYTDARIEEKGTKGLLLHHSAPPIAKVQTISQLTVKAL